MLVDLYRQKVLALAHSRRRREEIFPASPDNETVAVTDPSKNLERWKPRGLKSRCWGIRNKGKVHQHRLEPLFRSSGRNVRKYVSEGG